MIVRSLFSNICQVKSPTFLRYRGVQVPVPQITFLPSNHATKCLNRRVCCRTGVPTQAGLSVTNRRSAASDSCPDISATSGFIHDLGGEGLLWLRLCCSAHCKTLITCSVYGIVWICVWGELWRTQVIYCTEENSRNYVPESTIVQGIENNVQLCSISFSWCLMTP